MGPKQEDILKIVQQKGPLLPISISRQTKISTTFAGAFLSELVSSKKVFMSNLRVGGSALYYVKEQKEKLQEYSKYLNPKEKEAFDLLKEKKVLQDTELTPVIRVALRSIKDFAKLLTVNMNSGKEAFWKWFLVSNQDVEKILRNKLKKVEIEKVEVVKPKTAVKQEVQKEETQLEPKKEEIKPEIKKEEEKKFESKPVEDELKKIEEEKSKLKLEILKLEENKELLEKEKLKEIERERSELEKIKQDLVKQKEELSKARTEKVTKLPDKVKLPPEEIEEKQEKLVDISKRISKEKDEFFIRLKKHFSEKNVNIVDFEIQRKNSEIDLLLDVPSVVGKIQYYCKAKNKKRCNEGDLSTAFVQGQLKKLPVLFLTSGKLTAKAQKMLEKEFKNLIISNIE